MTRAQFEHPIRAAGAVLGVNEVLVIGSQALHGSIADGLPAEAQRSIAVDVAGLHDPDGRQADLIDGSIGEASMFYETFGDYALGSAHSLGVIHRDIKPENILLQGGHALVADFGIALAVQTAGGARLTPTGVSIGTPHYMSPEQAMGERSLDARSDIYALGAVMTALAKLPADRYATCEAFASALGASAAPPVIAACSTRSNRPVLAIVGNGTRMKIFLRPVSGGRATSLTDDTLAVETQPQWSQNGSRIAFVGAIDPNGERGGLHV